MRFSLRSALFFITGAGLVAFAGTISSLALAGALSLFLAIIGALVGRRCYWISCLLAGFGGALALWIGLLLHAFVLPWNYLADTHQESTARQAYQQFVRDTFVPQSAFVILQGLVLGLLVATLLWLFTRLANRFRHAQRQK